MEGLPSSMIPYLEHYNSNGTTNFNGSHWVSSPILTTRGGLKQGDPLSSVLFNIVIDNLLELLPRECRQRFGSGVTRAIALADDMNLTLETPQGLNALINHSTTYLLQCGIKINQAHTVSVVGLGK